MKQPLVSIVIPTYRRYQYLKDCILSLLNVKSENIEFVIQDNTEDNSEIIDFINMHNDSRLLYYHRPDHVSVMENCDLAVSHSSGKYICMIGDDDAVSSRIIKIAEVCLNNGIESCTFIFPGFNWPDMTFEAKKREANLFFQDKADGHIETVDLNDVITNAVKEGSAPSKTMPRLYHGLVSRECLTRIYKNLGTYFPGPSPDAANSIPVTLESKNCVRVYDYAIISGYGKASARGEGNRGQHYGELKDKPWLPKDILERWNKNLPPIFSSETILAQSMLEALKVMNSKDLLKQFGFDKVYAVFFLHHKDARGRMIRFCVKNPKRLFLLCRGLVKRYFERRKYLKNPQEHKNYKEYENVVTLMDAQRITEEMCKEIKEYHFNE